jgi:precorrin-2 dehydrogenase/sirohydrochlorin ferrochelatase
MLRLKHKPCLIVGGGAVAERKTLGLLQAGAEVTVISPSISGELESLRDEGRIRHLGRVYEAGDLGRYRLVVAATDDRKLNHQIFREAENRGILVNCVDDPENCNFFVPAVIRRGSLILAISTSGTVPALAKALRRFFERKFYTGFAQDLEELRAVRSTARGQHETDRRPMEEDYKDVLQEKIDTIIKKLEKSC